MQPMSRSLVGSRSDTGRSPGAILAPSLRRKPREDAMNARVSSSLGGQMLRALRLDPTLYREVSAPGGSTWQAALVLLLAAVSAGLFHGTSTATYWTNTWVGWSDIDETLGVAKDVATGLAASVTLAHIAAWPIWAAGMWAIGKGRTAPGGQTPGFRQIARALAFAQAPAIVGGLVGVPLSVGGLVQGDTTLLGLELFLGLFADLVWSAVRVTVLIGTYLAVREVLGLSGGRALGALITVGVAIAVGLSLVLTFVTVIVVAIGAEPDFLVSAWWRWASDSAEFGDATAPSVVSFGAQSAAVGLDFSLGLRLNLMSFYRTVEMLVGSP